MKIKGWGIGLVAVALVGGIWWWMSGDSDEPEGHGAMEVRTAEVQRGELVLSVASVGTIRPAVVVEIKSKASGQIVEFNAEEGDLLTAGQTVAKLDPVNEERNVAQAENSLSQAESSLEIARIDLRIRELEYANSVETSASELEAATANLKIQDQKLERMRALYKDELVSKAELESAELEYQNANDRFIRGEAAVKLNTEMSLTIERKRAEITQIESNVKQVEIELEEARERLSETVLVSPINATLLKKEAQIGQIVSSGISSASGGSTIAYLADLATLFIDAKVDETEIGKIEVGQPVRFTVDAFRGKEFPAVVERILPEGQNESNVILFQVRIRINPEKIQEMNPGIRLLPNMTANVQIDVKKKIDAVYVPARAVRFSEMKPYVYVAGAEGEEPKKVAVKTGLENGSDTEILEGVKLGDEVLTAGFPDMPAMPGGFGGRRGR